MHNLTSIDKVCQVRNAFRTISGHSKNACSYLIGLVKKIYNLAGSWTMHRSAKFQTPPKAIDLL